MENWHFNDVIVEHPDHQRRENQRLVPGRVGAPLLTVSSSLRHFRPVSHPRQTLAGASLDLELARDADVIHGDPSDHVDHLVAKPAAKIPDTFGALMFGHDAIEMFEIVYAKGNALSFQERWARVNASRDARQGADAAVGYGKSAQLNRDVIRFDRYVDP